MTAPDTTRTDELVEASLTVVDELTTALNAIRRAITTIQTARRRTKEHT